MEGEAPRACARSRWQRSGWRRSAPSGPGCRVSRTSTRTGWRTRPWTPRPVARCGDVHRRWGQPSGASGQGPGASGEGSAPRGRGGLNEPGDPTPEAAEPAEPGPCTTPLIGWLDTDEVTTLILLRHGVTQFTMERRFSGPGGAEDPGLIDERSRTGGPSSAGVESGRRRSRRSWLRPCGVPETGRGCRGGTVPARCHRDGFSECAFRGMGRADIRGGLRAMAAGAGNLAPPHRHGHPAAVAG